VHIPVEQPIGKLIQRHPDVAKSISQTFENVIQFAAACDGVRGNQLKVRATDLLVKFNVGSAPQTAVLSRDGGMKNSADEQRIITDMRPEQERLLGSGARQRDQDVGDVLLSEMMRLIGDLQPARVRKTFE